MVLFVDDNEDNCRPFMVYLQRRGMEVEWADSGPAALELMRHRTPAVVVLDEMMPDMTGRETLQRMRQHPTLATVPVIFFTGSTLEEHDVIDPDVVGFFRKASLDVADMCQRIIDARAAGLKRNNPTNNTPPPGDGQG